MIKPDDVQQWLEDGYRDNFDIQNYLMVEVINKMNVDDIFNGLNGINTTNIYE